jgi:hypothetical protein
MDMHPGPALHNLYGMKSVSSAMTCPVADDRSGSEASSYSDWSLAGSAMMSLRRGIEARVPRKRLHGLFAKSQSYKLINLI